jgi:hypothetical protein
MDHFDAEPSNTLHFGKNAAIGTIVKRNGAHLWYDEKLDTWIITDSSSYAISPILLDTDPNATQIMNLTALQPNVGFLCPPLIAWTHETRSVLRHALTCFFVRQCQIHSFFFEWGAPRRAWKLHIINKWCTYKLLQRIP